MPSGFLSVILLLALVSLNVCCPGTASALASNNIPFDSPVYLYLEKLASYGLVTPFNPRGSTRALRPAPFPLFELLTLAD